MTRAELLRRLENYGRNRAERDAYNAFFDKEEDWPRLTTGVIIERAFRRWYNDADDGAGVVGDEPAFESVEDATERVAAFLHGYVPAYRDYYLPTPAP